MRGTSTTQGRVWQRFDLEMLEGLVVVSGREKQTGHSRWHDRVRARRPQHMSERSTKWQWAHAIARLVRGLAQLLSQSRHVSYGD